MSNGLAVDTTSGGLVLGPNAPVDAGSFTYTCWALFSGGSTGCLAGMGGNDFGTPNSYLYIVIFGGVLQLWTNDGASTNIGTGVFPPGWQFVALVANAGTATAYVGDSAAGVVTTASGVVTGNVQRFNVSNTAEGDGYWTGSIAGFKLWNQPLSQAEVFREASQRSPVRKQGLVSYFPFWAPTSAALDQVTKSSAIWAQQGTFGLPPSAPPIREYALRPQQWSFLFAVLPQSSVAVQDDPIFFGTDF